MAEIMADALRGAVISFKTGEVLDIPEEQDFTTAEDVGEENGSEGVVSGIIDPFVHPYNNIDSDAKLEIYSEVAIEFGAAVDLGLNPRTINRQKPGVQNIYEEQVELTRAFVDATLANIARIQEEKRRKRPGARRSSHLKALPIPNISS